MKVIVAQVGARRRYAVAKIFEEEGKLLKLYTDSSNQSFLGRIGKVLGRISPKIMRLSKRYIAGVPRKKIVSTDALIYSDFLNLRKKESLVVKIDRYHRVLSKKFISEGVQDADAVYVMHDELNQFVRFCKDEEKIIILDTFINPTAHRVLFNLANSNEDWENPFTENEVALLEKKYLFNAKLANIILCPSEFVKQGVLQLYPEAESKIKIVPYGISFPNVVKAKVARMPNRVLWAGNSGLLKGLPILARAAGLKELLDVNFVIAGKIPENIQDRISKKHSNIKFLGVLSKKELMLEYQKASVFVLPTHSEGLAGVVLEAVQFNLPIITTIASGIDFTGNNNQIHFLKENNYKTLGREIIDVLQKEQQMSKDESIYLYYSYVKWKERLICSIKNKINN